MLFIVLSSNYLMAQSCKSWLKAYPDLPSESIGMVSDDEGNLYVGFNSPSNMLTKFNPDGDILWSAESPNSKPAKQIFFDNDTVYVTAEGNSSLYIYKFSLLGDFIEYITISWSDYSKIDISGNYIAVCKSGMFTKMSLSGNVIYSKQYPTSGGDPWESYSLEDVAINGEDIYFIRQYSDGMNMDFSTALYRQQGASDPVYLNSYANIGRELIAGSENKMYLNMNLDPYNLSYSYMITIDGSGGLIYQENDFENCSIAGMFYDVYRDNIIYTLEASNYAGNYDDYAIITTGNTHEANIKNIHYVDKIAGFAATENNVYFCGRYSGGMYIDYTFLAGSGFFIAKCSDDFSLVSDDVNFAGEDKNIACGESTMIGNSFVNPFVADNPTYLFNELSYNWNDENSSSVKYIEVKPFETRDYTVDVSTGACIYTQTVGVNVSKETHFKYTVNNMTISLELLSDELEDFNWDYGDGNSNNFNPKPTYTYSTEGSFSICLSAVGNDFLCSTCAVVTFPGYYTDSTNSTSGIDEINRDKMEIFPNPVVNGNCTLRLPNNYKGKCTLILTDLMGKTLFSEIIMIDPVNDYDLHLPNNLKGLFILSIETQNGTTAQKLRLL